MSVIKITVNDQNLLITDAPKIAAQGVNENYIQFTFSTDWDGFGKTANFYRDTAPTVIYQSVVDQNGYAAIPHEITANESWICIGLSGVKDDVVKTSEILKYKIVNGLYVVESTDPTPDVYEQILTLTGNIEALVTQIETDTAASVAAIEESTASSIANIQETVDARMDTFIASQTGTSNGTLITETSLFTASSPAKTDITVSDDINNYDYIDIRYAVFGRTKISRFLPSDIAAGAHWSEFEHVNTIDIDTGATDPNARSVLRKVGFKLTRASETSLSFELEVWRWDGKSTTNGVNAETIGSSWNVGIYSITGVKYEAAGSSKDAELTDIRVGADGVTYATAGEAVRTQFTNADNDIQELKEDLTLKADAQKTPAMTSGDGDADLYISDDSGNALAKFQNGGFQVKKFKGFDFVTFRSETKVYTGAELTFAIACHFAKGDRIVLHMERGAMPWEYGAYVTYTAGQIVVAENWRGDCAWLEYTLTEDVDEITAVYPASSTFVPRSTDITFEVSLLGDVPIRPSVVTVKQDGTGDFTTLRGALDSIGTKANDVLNPYRIEIYPGTYDVLADYTDDEIGSAAYTQTDFVGPKLLNGMYLIGMGAFPEETVLIASLDPNDWSNTIRSAISTLNCQGTCGFENLTVEAHNIRYCVHDDYHTPLKKKPKRVVKNCIFRGYNISYTPGHTYGASTTSSGCDFEFINCDFGEVALIHTLPTMQFRPYIHFINCTGSGFMIGDYETATVEATGRYVCRLDGCGFPWVKNSLDSNDAVSHAFICGSGSRSPLYQLPAGTPYLTDDVTVVPNVLLQFTGGVGTVVERYSDTGHGPRFRLATSTKTADGVVVYQDDDNTYIQTRGYIRTDRTNLTQFALGDYVGLSSGDMVVVSDPADAFAQIRYIDASGYGYLMLKGV